MIKINLMKGDCLELLKEIPDKSVDMALTDPPYGITQNKWDVVIPFEPMWEQLKRVVKPDGPILIFGNEPFSSLLRISNLKEFKYDWVWQKTKASNFLNAKKQPLKKIELVSVFYRNRAEYFPQGLLPYNKIRSRKSSAGTSKNFGEYKQENFSEFTNYPSELLNFPQDSYVYSTYKNGKKAPSHPTQKPVALLEFLIKTYTREGETVLDFTMGSGSTGVACKNLNRNFIGIERDDKYFEIAEKRINAIGN